jgi:ABC-type multidrug transport system ATPase subunit
VEDPLPRCKFWDILLAERGSQATIMATNFLDEADLLADQIAILSKDTCRAQGPSAALNHILGCGYRIHLPSGPNQTAPDIDGVRKHFTFGQAMYVASTSSQAAQIIRRLESEGLDEYQLSGPTIEDIFLQLAHEI